MRKAFLFGLLLCLATVSPAVAQGKSAAAPGKSMYGAVRRYEGVTNTPEATKRVNEGFVPLISKMKGFVAYYLVDAGNGVIVSTSIFRTQAEADESTKAAASWVKANLAALVPNPPQVTAGAVVAHKAK